jgi:cytidylate kinase
MNHSVIAIDGPAGSGKSTTARLVARRLGFVYLDTGAMYRCITLLAIENEIAFSDGDSLAEAARSACIEFRIDGDGQRTLLNGNDVTDAIRSPEVTQNVSEVSAHAAVREELVKRQREYARRCNLVAEGRDTTSVVFPRATLKVYLVADVRERARRRVAEFKSKGLGSSVESQIEDINRRDQYDTSRETSPLTETDDSVRIDTSNLSIDGQVDKVIQLYRKRFGV